MALALTQSTQFKIKELSLVTKLGVVNLANLYQEINIFDNMFMPCMKGDILINDSIGLADKLVLDGSEYIIVTISKDEENNQTHFDQCNEGRRPRISWEKLYPQIKEKTSLIFNGTFDEIF